MGRIFDDCGNRMTPSHSNKDGVRYRYYVSHVLLQCRKKDAGRVTRVPAIKLENLCRRDDPGQGMAGYEAEGRSFRSRGDRPLRRAHHRPPQLDRHELREPTVVPAPLLDAPENADVPASSTCTTLISLPRSVPAFTSVKGVLHQPEAKPMLKQETRDAILLAVAKASCHNSELTYPGCATERRRHAGDFGNR
jgi:site-specific DNA recombinase